MGLIDGKCYVHMPGQTLEIEICDDGRVMMTGDVCHVGKVTLGHTFSENLRKQNQKPN